MKEDNQDFKDFMEWSASQKNQQDISSPAGEPKLVILNSGYAELMRVLGKDEREKFINEITANLTGVHELSDLGYQAVLLGIFVKAVNDMFTKRVEQHNSNAASKNKVKLTKWTTVFIRLMEILPKIHELTTEMEKTVILLGKKSKAVAKYGLQTRKGQYLVMKDVRGFLEELFPSVPLSPNGLRNSEINILALTIVENNVDREIFLDNLENKLLKIPTLRKGNTYWLRFKRVIATVHEAVNEVLDDDSQKMTRAQVSTCLRNSLNFRTKIPKFSERLEGKRNRLYIPYRSVRELIEKTFEVL